MAVSSNPGTQIIVTDVPWKTIQRGSLIAPVDLINPHCTCSIIWSCYSFDEAMINWLVLWNIWIIFSPSYWEWNNHPNWRSPWFFRGVGQPPARKGLDDWYSLVNIQKTMEHRHVSWVNPLFRLGHGFNSYVTFYQRVSSSCLDDWSGCWSYFGLSGNVWLLTIGSLVLVDWEW